MSPRSKFENNDQPPLIEVVDYGNPSTLRLPEFGVIDNNTPKSAATSLGQSAIAETVSSEESKTAVDFKKAGLSFISALQSIGESNRQAGFQSKVRTARQFEGGVRGYVSLADAEGAADYLRHQPEAESQAAQTSFVEGVQSLFGVEVDLSSKALQIAQKKFFVKYGAVGRRAQIERRKAIEKLNVYLSDTTQPFPIETHFNPENKIYADSRLPDNPEWLDFTQNLRQDSVVSEVSSSYTPKLLSEKIRSGAGMLTEQEQKLVKAANPSYAAAVCSNVQSAHYEKRKQGDPDAKSERDALLAGRRAVGHAVRPQIEAIKDRQAVLHGQDDVLRQFKSLLEGDNTYRFSIGTQEVEYIREVVISDFADAVKLGGGYDDEFALNLKNGLVNQLFSGDKQAAKEILSTLGLFVFNKSNILQAAEASIGATLAEYAKPL